jgi:hypothetical protein
MNQSPEVKTFIAEIVNICRKYNFSIAHEDTQGGFIIEKWNPENIEWFGAAFDKTENNAG